ncbi:hypothetical protein [Candidatus Ichthyocystis hellenicum]|uniref:hypothetical protein n=1 Tax=Candidatus Ichthyocystis hellenicum TaxID=1561003 RepID=UPI001111E63D|nr:hypothetical protein [Candidatus Ichthyocystis hellenicum]
MSVPTQSRVTILEVEPTVLEAESSSSMLRLRSSGGLPAMLSLIDIFIPTFGAYICNGIYVIALFIFTK